MEKDKMGENWKSYQMSGLYIHIPFCVHKCPYCGFYSVPYNKLLVSQYINSLKREMKSCGGVYDTVYVGGGTPSCLSPSEIETILKEIYKNFEIKNGAEFTFELNPESITSQKLDILKSYGANRMSIGFQSLNDTTLSFLGRIHKTRDCIDSYLKVRDAGFKNVSLDFIAGVPGENIASFKSTIRDAIKLDPEHISIYCLTIENGTEFARRDIMVDEEKSLLEFKWASEFLRSNGYEWYEISNFAKEGKKSVHNQNYWMSGEWLGLGPSAHSYLNGYRFCNSKGVNYNIIEKHKLTNQEKREEMIFLSLRTKNGLNLKKYEKIFGERFEDKFSKPLNILREGNFIKIDKEKLSLTEKGIYVSDSVIGWLISYR